ncbi:dihydrofolate reductase-like domain-containing protein [Talaromyces proteolyticus]|uniref:Dihydrofolate reductase n=1 Tax=Talaromyces proteolyticus TaxID=1131652 RepID=A0AAD4KU07_9EURO|nr:dihydrofolate reductase-like domain-containing protein [Talaromyces proteolyticus]KAH8696059.1 dihydrofolate reductase-like domain-containing protein [Talaromyces proteolyticus]
MRNPITLIVATTPIKPSPQGETLLGIGKNGTLPWPRIKSDMNFFARVSTRLPTGTETTGAGALNAIVMGRKTYYSLPKSLRPLKDRLNVVITRDTVGGVREEIEGDLERQREKDAEKERGGRTRRGAVVANSLDDALATLARRADVGSVFVIGGGEIYASALRLSAEQGAFGEKLRILMTRVKKGPESGEGGFDCDTFFPLTDDDLSNDNKWREASAAEVSQWVGEEVSSEWLEDSEVSIRVVGYERQS